MKSSAVVCGVTCENRMEDFFFPPTNSLVLGLGDLVILVRARFHVPVLCRPLSGRCATPHLH